MPIDISHLPSPEEIEKNYPEQKDDVAPTVNSGVDISRFPSPEDIQNTSYSNPSNVIDDKPSELEATLRGGAQGISAGFSDEAIAGLQAAGNTLMEDSDPKLSGLEHLLKNYHKAKAYQENREKQAQEDSPWLYNSAMFGAGFVPVGAALKGASMAGKIGRSAGMAALNAYGNSGLSNLSLNLLTAASKIFSCFSL